MNDFRKTTSLGTFLATLISLSMGVFAYMTFWEETSSDLFSMYKPSTAVDTCRMLLCVSMLLTYPFPFLTVRELIILKAFENKPNMDTENDSWLLPGAQRQLVQPYHFILTLILWASSLSLALSASSLGAVLNLTGCATGTGTYWYSGKVELC